MDGSYSNLTNLNFYTNATSENSNYLTPIYINEASDLVIENNPIYIDYSDGCNYNLAGIYAFGASNNNIIGNNRISIYSRSLSNTSKHYIYGIDFSSYSSNAYSKDNAKGNDISSNTIDIISDYYANAITLSCAVDTTLESNSLHLKSDSFVYGMVAEYFDFGNGLNPSNNFNFTKNTIEASSNMVYAIQFFNVFDVNIKENTIKTNSNGSYGISAYESYNHDIGYNNLFVNGNDVSMIGTNFDAIGTGHSGIYYMRDSHDLSIHDNNVLSNYSLGGDYAIRFDASSSENINVFKNNLSSNNGKYLGNDAVNGNVTVSENNHYYGDNDLGTNDLRIFDIYVDLNGNDNKGDGSIGKPFKSISKALSYLKNLTNIYGSSASSSSTTKVKGIIHLGEGKYNGYGTNLRIYITGLDVEIFGSGYNKTIIDGVSSHWFFDISEDSSVSIKNLSLANGVYRYNDGGLIHNKGNLYLENCIFDNAKMSPSSAIIYNDGILNLKNNLMNMTANGYHIYNNGFIDGLYLNFIGDSLSEDERLLNTDSLSFILTAYVHDDNGNPITGGYIRFFIEGKEILVNSSLIEGLAKLYTFSSLNGIIKISGYYSNAYTNLFVNIGKVNSSIISDTIKVYVNYSANESKSDGSFEKPFKSINDALDALNTCIEPVTITVLDDETTEQIDDSRLNRNNVITIESINKTNISTNWTFKSDANIRLKGLIFDGYGLVKDNTYLTIDNCLFNNTPASAIVSTNGSLTLLNSNFTNNNVKDNHTFYTGFSTPVITTSLWDIQYDYDKGGAVDNSFSNLTILNCNFAFNEAYNGGAIFNNQSDLHISNSSFTSNLAFSGFYENPRAIDFSNAMDKDQDRNVASKGGAIFQYLGEEVVVTDTGFLNNTAGGYGGAFYSSGIYPYRNDSSSIIEGIPFIVYETEDGLMDNFGNYADNLLSPQDIYFINCNFDSNVAPIRGGAVYCINNSQTQYISCNFGNNLVYTYNMSQLFGGLNKNSHRKWIFEDELDQVYSIFFTAVNNGGAIHDENLKIIDSTFTANTLQSGGSILLPSVIRYSADVYTLPKNTAGAIITNSGKGGESVYVADSSLLTSEDSKYIGINGWTGTSTGGSIRRIIHENGQETGTGGNGSGTGGSGNGSGTGKGAYGNSLSWSDILSALGGDARGIAINGEGSSFSDFISGLINGKSSSNSSSDSQDNGSGSSNSSSQNPVNGTIPSNSSSDSQDNGSGSSNSSSQNPVNGTIPSNSSSDSQDNVSSSSNSSSTKPMDDSNKTNSTSDVPANDTVNATDGSSDSSISENPVNGTASNDNNSSDVNGGASDMDDDNISNLTNSSSEIPVDTNINDTNNSSSENSNSTTDLDDSEDKSDVDKDDKSESDDVGLSDNPLNGDVSESSDSPDSPDSPDSSESSDSPSSPDSSSSDYQSSSSAASPGDSSNSPSSSSSSSAYKIYEEEIDDNILEKNVDLENLLIIIVLFLGLIILGYYKKSKEDEDN
ncbi:adhesin-like protein [Methanobrevibacter ruminantium M1]|uniref:Adhesin-like protein n=1 Tax=Methanobrevibacter ruminantium (strain ATCC 35063 / DSM 1093 / JCM 13430 / OCM 146 / M1) TaxID=634498 RepID=D3E2R7_METRM|nr:hypothetical protein [Methanobrevibacter ruminantium]ADC46828.1 adhesin-like protein [Methanobrevibacter ruminantium M1]